MDGYDDFARCFLIALFWQTEQEGETYVTARSILSRYNLNPKPHWIVRMADEWEHIFFKDVAKVLSGPKDWSFTLAPEGYREVEQQFDQESLLREFVQKMRTGTVLPDGVSELPAGRTFMAPEGTDVSGLSMQPGDMLLEYDGAEPASTDILREATPVHDSRKWTGAQFVLVDTKIIEEVRARAAELQQAVLALHLPSNSETEDLQRLAEALLAICQMTEPDASMIDRITASPKFKAISGLFSIVATIRGAIGL